MVNYLLASSSVEVSMNKKIYVLLALCILIWGCASFTLDSYAPSHIRAGTTWRVYLRAKDPDGDMKETIQVLVRGGSGPFKTSFVPLRAEHSAEMGGYFFLRTPSPTQADYDRLGFLGLTLRIALLDCQKNKSEYVEFPLHFTFEAPPDLPPKWKDVADRSLGAIMFDLGDLLNANRGSN